jgi:hypothetical protein
VDTTQLAIQFAADFIAGGSEDMEGTGGNTAVPTDWSDGGQIADDTMLALPENVGIWIPGATCIITVANDFNWSPKTLVLPLTFVIDT